MDFGWSLLPDIPPQQTENAVGRGGMLLGKRLPRCGRATDLFTL